MFRKNTVFILGAGASWHYGYPTGEVLVRMVWEKAGSILKEYGKPNGDRKAALAYPSTYPRNFQNDFREAFYNKLADIQLRIAQANPLVIDDFLGRNAGIADVGKLLIAMVLFDCGKKGGIRPRKLDKDGRDIGDCGDWVRYIVQQLTVDCKLKEDEPEDPKYLLDNNVSFFTFNYDLSLEYQLCRALKNYEWFSDGGISDRFFSDERFLHVYGQLYKFDPASPFPPRGSYRNLNFPLADEIDRAYDAAQNIKTITPGKLGSIDPKIPSAIAGAEYLYFLGYGFDRRNNELLGLGRWQKGFPRQAIKFTNFGNLNKVSRQVEVIYNRPRGSLAGPNYFAEFEDPLGRRTTDPPVHRWTCEKSIKSVYDALAEDFDWPE